MDARCSIVWQRVPADKRMAFRRRTFLQSLGFASGLLCWQFLDATAFSQSESTVTAAVAPAELDRIPQSAIDVFAPGQQVGLTLDQIEAMALQCHPSIQRANALVHAARGRAFQVGLGPNPNAGFEGQQLGSDGRAEQYGVLLGKEFVVRDKLRLNRATVQQEVRQLEQDLQAQQQRVLTDVRIAFYRVLRAEKQIEANRELVEISQKAVAVADSLFKAKEVGRVDSLQASIEIESARIQLQNAENRYQAAWQELSAVSGQSMLVPQPLNGDLFGTQLTLDFEQELSRLEQQSPELHAILATIDQARTNLRRQQIEVRPNVTVQGLLNWRDNGVNGDSNAGLAVSIPIPVKNRNQGAIQEARFQISAAQHQFTQRQLDLRQRLANAFERYNNARSQADRYREQILPMAEQTLDLTRRAYEAGEIGFINLLTVQRTYVQSRLATLEIAESLRVAEAEIHGLMLRDSLTK